MKQDDNFYNVQVLLNVVFLVLAVAGLFGFLTDFKTIMLELVVIILKQDLLRAELKKVTEFVHNLERIEE